MIGVLDSGVGGLSIYGEIKRRLPSVGIIYYADKRNFPYGDKTEEELLTIVRTAVRTLIENGAKVIVLACNSATVSTVSKLRAEFDILIVGIEPAIKQAAKNSKNGKIGVLATKRTVGSHESEALAPGCTLCKEHNEALIYKIENDYTSITDEDLAAALKPFITADVDSIVLGCTHYHFAKERFEKLAPEITFYAPTGAVVDRFMTVISENTIEFNPSNDIFLCSRDSVVFANSLNNLLGIKDADIREI